MNFILKMAWRDSRASRRRLLLFSLSVVLGIAALIAIGSFSANLDRAIQEQAKGLLGADLVVVARTAPDAALRDYLAGLGGEQAREQMFSSMAVFPSAGGATRLVQVRAVEGNFPFYGDFVTAPADAPARLRAGGNVVILEETLLDQFGVKVGGEVKLGRTMFTVVGALRKLPGEPLAVAMIAPRAFIPLGALADTGLLGAGSDVLMRYRVELKLPPDRDPAAVVDEMRERFAGQRLGYDTVEQRKRALGRALENIQGFLGLVGFVALFLGAIGVASAIHVYVRQKTATVAVLRCLGASARQSFAVYLVQGVALGAFGALLGAALGIAVQLVLPSVLKGMLPFDVDFFVAWFAVGRGMAAGFVICVLFALLPLLAIRRVPPLAALRSSFADDAAAGPDPWRVIIGVLIVLAVAGFAVWQTHSVRVGAGFTGMFAVGFAVLGGLARLVAWAARRWLPRRLPYVVRQGVANLYRPNNRTVLLLLALGLGTYLILTLYLARTTLLSELATAGGPGRANLLFFDIQDDQIKPLDDLVAAQDAPVVQEAAIVTMRISALKGRPVEELLRDQGDRGPGRGRREGEGLPGWTLRREYRSTFRDHLAPTEEVVQGNFTGRVEAGTDVVPVSLEQGLFDDMQLKLGDEITWDVQGVPIRSRVTSVRKVDWRRLEPNFFAVFPDGVLEAAPKFHVVAVHAGSPSDSGRIQRAVVGAFPNVTAIDLGLVMQTIDDIVSKVSFVIEFLALFTVATGVIVLAGAVLNGRYQRIRETVLLRTLGASRRQLAGIQLVEYAILGVLGALVGSVLAVAGNALLAHFVFELPPVAPPLELLTAVVAVATVTLVTGWISNRGITRHPPLEVLRQET
ncbi:MAG TPA: FtsX-like permease family protein [Opitutaceae bacterium]|nr:FtsX-like permease family protein [Opitutaceae bacterium]